MDVRDRADHSRGLWRALAVAGVTLVAVYLFNLGGNVLVAGRAREQEARLSTEVAVLEAQVTALHAALATATTDAAVEQWARGEQQWARPGDHVIAPLPGPAAAQGPSGSREGSASWWDRFRHWLRPEQSPSEATP